MADQTTSDSSGGSSIDTLVQIGKSFVTRCARNIQHDANILPPEDILQLSVY